MSVQLSLLRFRPRCIFADYNFLQRPLTKILPCGKNEKEKEGNGDGENKKTDYGEEEELEEKQEKDTQGLEKEKTTNDVF